MGRNRSRRHDDRAHYYLPRGTIANAAKDSDYVFDPAVHGSNRGALPSAETECVGYRQLRTAGNVRNADTQIATRVMAF